MEDKTETVLDHTYLQPGIVTRAGAVGLAAIGIRSGPASRLLGGVPFL
jgi:hypothetical protein